VTATEPLFEITSGTPTADELTAVTVLLLAIAGSQGSGSQASGSQASGSQASGSQASGSRAAGGRPVQQVGGWADPALRLRRPLPPGPGAWRASAWS
jgi:Acyl-CoA carboxylase epsilon subunit